LDRYGRPVTDRLVERLDQVFHAGLHVKGATEERSGIRDQIPDLLPRNRDRWDEFLAVTLASGAGHFDQRLVILIEDQTVFRTVDAKLMQRGMHLRRKREIGGRALIVGDDDAKLVDDFAFTQALELRADEPVRDDGS